MLKLFKCNVHRVCMATACNACAVSSVMFLHGVLLALYMHIIMVSAVHLINKEHRLGVIRSVL